MKKIQLFTGVMIAWTLFLSCESETQEKSTASPQQVKYVKSTVVEEIEIVLPVYAFGRLATKDESKLSFKTGGIIRSIFVNEGQQVKKGQILAQLDQKEINAQVASAKANFLKTERDLVRMEKLHMEKVVTLEAYQNVKTQYDVAVSNLEIAEFNRQFSTIYAPVSGRILRKFAEKNELTTAGNPVFTIGGMQSGMIIRAGLADKEVINLQVGDSAQIQFDAMPDKNFVGEIYLISNAPDPQSNLYEVKINLHQPDIRLRNGFFAKAMIFPRSTETYKMVPMDALVEGEKKQGYIYTIENSKARKVEIDISDIDKDMLLVSNANTSFSEVVIEGAQYLDPNDEVVVLNQ